MTDRRFRPAAAEPVDLGPVTTGQHPVQRRPIDEYLTDLYGPGPAPKPLIEAEPAAERSGSRFPLAMWAWSAAVLATAITAAVLMLG